jgi:hypothetical protein
MKKIQIKTFLMIICFMMITSCNDSNQAKEVSNLKTEIPIELSENEAVKEYFAALDQVVNEYVNMVEDMAELSQESKEGDDEGFGAAMKMLTSASGSLMTMAPLLEKMEKLEKEAQIMQNDMSEEELIAFMDSYLKLINRFQEASLKIN